MFDQKLFILPISSSKDCISAYARIPSYKYEHVYIQLIMIAPCSVLHVASYWRMIFMKCWLLYGAISGLGMIAKGGGGCTRPTFWMGCVSVTLDLSLRP